MILCNSVLLLAAVNLAVNAALGLTILLGCPHAVWPIPVMRPDRWYEKRHPKTTEKGETPNEQSME